MKFNLKNPIILVDGSSYLYRAYYAFRYFKNSKGKSVGTIYGVLHMLRSLYLRYKPTHMVIAFDNQTSSFRKEIYRDYKSNRNRTPKEIILQIPCLYEIICSMGFPIFSVERVEADDIIGTISKFVEKNGMETIISSNDKDMMQLITSKISIINNMKNKLISLEKIKNMLGIAPKFIVDLLSLSGDYTDNIPGVPGIGKKTALFLIKKFGNLFNLYNKIEKEQFNFFSYKKRIFQNLIKYRDQSFLYYRLITIKKDVQFKLSFEKLKLQKPDKDKLLSIYTDYGFYDWIKKINFGVWEF